MSLTLSYLSLPPAPLGLATHVFGTSRLHRTPRDPYTVGKSVVGSFQHCTRPPHTRTQTGDTRTDTRALPACQRCRRVPQARASATHARLLLHTIETSAPAASRRYADAAQRPTLARVVKVLPHRMRVLAPARQILPAPAPDAPRTYPRSSLQPIAADCSTWLCSSASLSLPSGPMHYAATHESSTDT